jgi:ubiquinol-cytochrome c reductase iron-sulfur subunit
MAGGLGLIPVYWVGGQPQLEGALLGVALGGLGAGLIMWGVWLLPKRLVTDRRELSSPERDRRAVEATLEETGEAIGRRRFLVRLLAGAAGALGLAALFPIRSLGPRPGTALFRTAWTPGALLVKEDASPVRVDDLPVGSVLTVFPDGHVGSSDAQTLLIRVDPGDLQLSPERNAWAPEGNVAYSKICTHAGCPVGLYRAETQELICPCHQSTFDVTGGAKPVFGPATRPLPQLALEVDEAGLLRARSDFTEPVGPAFWNRP